MDEKLKNAILYIINNCTEVVENVTHIDGLDDCYDGAFEDDYMSKIKFKELLLRNKEKGKSDEVGGRLFSIFQPLDYNDINTLDKLASGIKFDISPAVHYTNFDILLHIQSRLLDHNIGDIIDKLYDYWVGDKLIPIEYQVIDIGYILGDIENESLCKIKILSNIIHCIAIWLFEHHNADAFVLVDTGMIIQNYSSLYYPEGYDYIMGVIRNNYLDKIKYSIDNEGYGRSGYKYTKFSDMSIINKAFEIYTRSLTISNFDKFIILSNIQCFSEYSKIRLDK